MESDSLKKEKSIEFKKLEAMRYRESCHIYCILEKFLKESGEGVLVLIERETKKEDGNKEELDSLIKMNSGDYCVLELKTSIRDDEEAKKALKQIKERDTNFIIDDKSLKSAMALMAYEAIRFLNG